MIMKEQKKWQVFLRAAAEPRNKLRANDRRSVGGLISNKHLLRLQS